MCCLNSQAAKLPKIPGLLRHNPFSHFVLIELPCNKHYVAELDDGMHLQVYTGKLSLVDLAGSERASETNNVGQQLRDGANINRCDMQLLTFCHNEINKMLRHTTVTITLMRLW